MRFRDGFCWGLGFFTASIAFTFIGLLLFGGMISAIAGYGAAGSP